MPNDSIEQSLNAMPERFGCPFDIDITPKSDQLPAPTLAVRWAGYQQLLSDDPPNIHENYPYAYLIFALEGQATLSSGSESWEINAGSVFWATAGADTKIELRDDSTCLSHYVVMTYGSEQEAAYLETFGQLVGCSQVIDPVSLASLFEVILDEACGLSTSREQNCIDLFKILLLRLNTQLIRDNRSLGSNARETFHLAHQYLQKNYDNITDLGALASHIGVSVPYLCRLYDKYSDRTAFAHLSDLKLTKAERLLCTTKMSLTDITTAVGYGEKYIFSRNFRKKYGLSPSYYRKNNTDQ